MEVKDLTPQQKKEQENWKRILLKNDVDLAQTARI
jgi:hypothetical protein